MQPAHLSNPNLLSKTPTVQVKQLSLGEETHDAADLCNHVNAPAKRATEDVLQICHLPTTAQLCGLLGLSVYEFLRRKHRTVISSRQSPRVGAETYDLWSYRSLFSGCRNA